ncbi:MAG: hypothetical protein HYU66_24255 [Armatimonadetes bacterium]|nr:hypothetical protein [Armatimonadota bacterium]
MGDILIRLRANVRTGQREIVVDYDSDPDMTQQEHERRHREIAERLVRDGILERAETEDLVFEPRPREPARPEPLSDSQDG